MKILLIHSDGVEVVKNREATSTPQEFKDKIINLEGLVLVAFVSVEDQDTYDVDVIAKQGATVIEEAILQITQFPEKIAEKNEEIRKHNEKIDLGKSKAKKRKLNELIADRSKYNVEKVLVYPWAHLSKFLSSESSAMDVCPKIANLLSEKGIESHYSPFGWYKAFKINCIGHEVAEMYRDVKLYIQPDEHSAQAEFRVILPSKKEINLVKEDKMGFKSVPELKKYKNFQVFLKSELGSRRVDLSEEPVHIKFMKEQELADFEPNSDKGILRWYTKGVIMKNLIKRYMEDIIIDYGAVLIDTPIMYSVKSKKLTAQTARFPARTYWVESGSDRFLLRFAGDFLQFDMVSGMNLKLNYLPLRLYEWEQYDFRREQEGELTGLRRLRGFVMPDFHTFCKDLDSAVEEFKLQYELNKKIAHDLGVKDYIIFRTTQAFYKENQRWIKDLVKRENKPALLELWEDRYYYFVLKFERGVLSAQDKSGTLATIQVDVESTLEYLEDENGKKREKYNVKFTDEDGEVKHPIILHNSPSGGLERILWGLIETAYREMDTIVPGFKTWLSPIQARIITVSNKQNDIAERLLESMTRAGFRVDFDDRDEKIGKKIRQAEVDWIPYSIVIGKSEQEKGTISVRKRLIGQEIKRDEKNYKITSEQINDIRLDDLLKMMEEDCMGYPRYKLPIPFRRFSTKVYFRH
ncbi:MAG: threonine--tRNA ligase [Candidatus Lokiarchaeota archaeon]|nr:threonine--tRNA ligase [Candidatus Lokiarchaeota archaeon]